jgi:hypothetical protein
MTQPYGAVHEEPQQAVVDPGCPHQDGASCNHPGGEVESQTEGTKLYGQALTEIHAAETALEAILKAPQEFHDQDVLVSGHVQRACSRRGCWMEIAPSPGDSGRGCRVTFKDYGFLVPTDAKGSHAKLFGKVQVTIIPQTAVQHYESEGGTFNNKLPDGTAREVRIVATGVELSRKS